MTDLHISAYEKDEWRPEIRFACTVVLVSGSRLTNIFTHKISVSCLMEELWFWIVAGRDGEMKGDQELVVGWTVLVGFVFGNRLIRLSNQTRGLSYDSTYST